MRERKKSYSARINENNIEAYIKTTQKENKKLTIKNRKYEMKIIIYTIILYVIAIFLVYVLYL